MSDESRSGSSRDQVVRAASEGDKKPINVIFLTKVGIDAETQRLTLQVSCKRDGTPASKLSTRRTYVLARDVAVRLASQLNRKAEAQSPLATRSFDGEAGEESNRR